MPDNTHPVVGERVRVKVGLTTIEGTVTDIYQASNGLRVVVETIDDDPELGRQVHTIAVPVEQIIIDGQRKDAPPSVPATPGQRRRGGAGKFVLKKGRTGKFHFNLVAGNGQVIATSETYETKAAAMNGIKSVQANVPEAEVESAEVQPD